MSNDGVNTSRRTFLIGLTSAIGAAGAVGLAVPFVKSWLPSAKAENAGAPVQVDISKLELGQRVVQEWRGQPVWVVNRTDKMLEGLSQIEGSLRDPNSEEDQQPPYAKNQWRSIKKEYLVLIGTCTHLGCSPLYEQEPTVQLDHGGFFCPCHGSMFDLAGRVYQGVPAPTNLVVPPHSYLSESVIIVGSEEGETQA
ncbi:ubiquinol-cytochrome c reductase iron-sulfur subunit [Alloalcanivorax xenomutans]|jgi:ubiquinol-cytochrome c reductase iron-sulfur subunit|uniref:Ubiquinol-cytochrome c reductase iron-sulfur subunit n=1 Tax=Alloalcanivorax xenomutans TaxID=1094342 RepID=A0A9Q3ZFK1_9GAMM|nr:ubiquinol-cytochrome c reductase iron-sulfur subunit [Alloalcanivorax xenomutans]ERS11872.1 iron-sulfur protein [Alcanivorax sp. PN-3]KYZ84301.1 ubiquinol-cytochrome c reductase iron-sulfur subunit [Alcanivorax sp. KX64203]MBA4720448.1 ubiquinol-cytochrome c reductase iron-sulfur subunit [Alcanivorax sp.]ARB46829.1 ubiquinol-cytochrome C reductase [Alloalcanivorax xenomutans]MCE7509746.1 ubiquinol-cytochrome c reductase iron-sulfur subunit [Alloalcanivorax xenomutans]|tara:strand:+ start:5118 stop:5705 length:588 start_codon:yes stop_codon:yes gene_type:complete